MAYIYIVKHGYFYAVLGLGSFKCDRTDVRTSFGSTMEDGCPNFWIEAIKQLFLLAVP